MKQPQRVTREDGTLTGATDERGVPLEPTHRDVEVLGAHRHAEYTKRRQAKIEELQERAEEERHYQRFREEFIASCGAPGDVKKAYADWTREQASEAARRADQGASTAQRVNTMGVI